MKTVEQESILPNQLLFDESFSSNMSETNSDGDESPLLGMARLLRKSKNDAKKESKKSKRSSSRRSLMLERKKKEKNAQEASSESTLVDECSAEQSVIKKSPGKLKDIRKKWEQQATESHRSSPRAATERQEDASHLKVRKTLNLWEHRLSENSPSNGGSPRSPLAIQILDTNSVQDPSFRDKKIKRDHFATTQQRAPPKRNELRDAFISLAFAFFMIGIAMLIHQPYGPLFEKGAFGTFPSADSIVIKFNEIGEYTKNGTNYVQEWMQQWKVTISNVLETWSSNGTEATKSPSAPSDVRHFLLL